MRLYITECYSLCDVTVLPYNLPKNQKKVIPTRFLAYYLINFLIR